MSDEFVELYYQVENDTPKIYKKPFHIPLDLWTEKGLDVTFCTELKTHSRETSQKLSPKKVHLNIARIKLSEPSILGPKDHILQKGCTVKISIDQKTSDVKSSFENLSNYQQNLLEYLF